MDALEFGSREARTVATEDYRRERRRINESRDIPPAPLSGIERAAIKFWREHRWVSDAFSFSFEDVGCKLTVKPFRPYGIAGSFSVEQA